MINTRHQTKILKIKKKKEYCLSIYFSEKKEAK